MSVDFTIYRTQDQVIIFEAIEKAIHASWTTNPLRGGRHEEAKRRYGMCCKLFTSMCLEARYLLGRFKDCLTEALKNELNGIPFSESRFKTGWTANKRKEYMAKDDYELNEAGILVPREQ